MHKNRGKPSGFLGMLLLAILVLAAAPLAQAKTVVFKIATVSPDGTSWMKKMRQGAEEIAARTQGRVTFKFYPGGIMGNDQSVLRKIRFGQLQGGAIIAGSLSRIYPEVQIYGLPMLFRSLDEVDYTRKRMDSLFIKGLEKHGFVTFGFAEGGFAHLMSNKPIQTIQDIKGKRIWVPEGDEVAREIFEQAGVTPIPLPISDVLTGLQTGLIDTVGASPIVAIALQWHTRLKYFTDTPLSYIYALLAIDKKAFKKVSFSDQSIIREVMGRTFKEIDKQNRQDNIKARQALQRQGIVFVSSSPEALIHWKNVAEKTRDQLKKKAIYNSDLLDTLTKHLKTYRNSHSSASLR